VAICAALNAAAATASQHRKPNIFLEVALGQS